MSGETHVREGRAFHVELTPAVGRAFEKVEVRKRARMTRWMEKLADYGLETLLPDTLKREDRFNVLGLQVTVYALREDVVRLYGGVVPQEGTTSLFLFTEIETKKRGAGKADQQRLERAARYVAERIRAGSTGGQR